MQAIQTAKISLVMALAVVFTGCFSGNVGQVEGTLTLDGKPIPNARISFSPVDGGRASMCENTDENGHYVLYFGTGKTDAGATVGQNRVIIKTLRRRFNENRERQDVPEILPAKFNTQSELVREVTSGSQVIDLTLTTAD